MSERSGFIRRLKRITSGLLSPPSSRGGWLGPILESYPGAWQQNVEISNDTLTSVGAVFACVTLIASDISKLRMKLTKFTNGAWVEATNTAYSPMLKRPNKNQNRIQFLEAWILSKLLHGNTYVLKVRDATGHVRGLKVLDPRLVQPLVSPDGSVFYSINTDNFNGIQDPPEAIPASEIIHDRYNCLFHPLVGISPLYSAGLAARQAWHIQNSQTLLFANGVKAPGILTAPGAISDEIAERLKTDWEAKYAGSKGIGKVAVLGDGLEFQAMSTSAVDAELIKQLDWTGISICSAFHVPPFMIGIGSAPPYTDMASVNLQYYSQALQHLIEAVELCVDEGVGLADDMGVELDTNGLLRMDAKTQAETITTYTKSGIMKLNEARRKIDLPDMDGGDSVYLQQQNFSLEALNKRDSSDDPFKTGGSSKTTQPSSSQTTDPQKSIRKSIERSEDDAIEYLSILVNKMEGFELEY
jgi:HK97 family phage portal protein